MYLLLLCVNSRASNWAVQKETSKTSITPLIVKRMVRSWIYVTESPCPIIQNTLELSKQLHKKAKTSWFASILKISELIPNFNEPSFNSKSNFNNKLSEIIKNT